MSWSSLTRVVTLARRSRHSHEGARQGIAGDVSARRRHPAMAGLNVPPVHGRHCICHRCERQANSAS
jgi:hypothetical protein